MSALQDNEIAILKQLHDGVIRPAWPMAQRAGLDLPATEAALQALQAKGLVEPRRGAKWKITYDGKVSLGVLPHSEGAIEQAMEHLAQVETDDIMEVAASQIQLLRSFYNLALEQAHHSFRWALAASIVGLIFFLAAVTFVLAGEEGSAATISVVSGAIVELIAGVNFYLYGRTTGQLSMFHDRLDVTQRFLLANSLCENLEGELKQQTRASLIARLVGVMTTDAGDSRTAQR